MVPFDAGLGEIVALSPRQSNAVDDRAALAPGINQGAEEGGFPGAGDADRNTESPTHPEAIDDPALCSTMVSAQIEAAPEDGARDGVARQCCRSVCRRSPRQPNELALLLDVKFRRNPDVAPATLVTPKQDRCLRTLPYSVLAASRCGLGFALACARMSAISCFGPPWQCL